MFKFFRKYNKWLLAVGGSLLMIVFLLPNLGGGGGGGVANVTLGYAFGDKVTQAQLNTARSELDVLRSYDPTLDDRGDASLAWVLMQRDAARMGLDVSDAEVSLIMQTLGLDDAALAQLRERLGIPADMVRQAFAHWAVSQIYADLVSGLRIKPPVERAEYLRSLSQLDYSYYQQLQEFTQGDARNMQQLEMTLNLLNQIYMSQRTGLLIARQAPPRISEPALKHFIFDALARARVSAVPVTYYRFMTEVDKPSAELMQELFDKHKSDLAGEGKPYGFGYRRPDRVKLEYLSVPLDRLEKHVKVEEADAYDYYNKHKDEFTSTLPTTQPGEADEAPKTFVQPWGEVRDQIRAALRAQRAEQLGDRMIKDAQSLLSINVTTQPDKDGYKDLSRGWQPRALSEVAGELQQRYGVLASVVRLEQWLDRSNLTNLREIGESQMLAGAGANAPRFVPYVMSAKELAPADDNPLIAMRLQVGAPSQPMVNRSGDRLVFRLTAGEPARTPEKLDEARADVEYNARQLMAYRLLLAELPKWRDMAQQRPLKDLANDQSATVIDSGLFTRRELTGQGAKAPQVPGIGASEAFVDAVFKLVEQVADQGPVKNLPQEQRADAIPVDQRLTVYLTVLEDVRPLTRNEYLKQARNEASAAVGTYLTMLEGRPSQPLLIETLKKRTSYAEVGGSTEEEKSETQKPEDDQSQSG
ncbi:MAG: hypothetical protein WD042_04930 [Phycisphaeraceae bacterium]